MSKKIPSLTKFKILNLNINNPSLAEESSLKLDRTISIKKHKDDNSKFMVSIIIKGMIITKNNEPSKNFKDDFEVSSASFFSSEENLENMTPSNELILCSVAQAYVLTSLKFKELLSLNDIDDSSVPVGIDFEI